jgi:hypothetical protein
MGGACSTHGIYEKSLQHFNKNLKERYDLVYLGIGVRIILKGILKKYDMRVCTGLSWLLIGTVTGHCDRKNQTSCFVKDDNL